MEKSFFTLDNCQLVTDDSCCLDNEELMYLHVITVPYQATLNEAKNLLKTTLREKEFVLFAGTAKSLSEITNTIEKAAKILDKEDKSLNAKKRVKTFNTSSFSGGLGFFITLFSGFVYSGEHTIDEIDAYSVFLANHIAHFLVEPNQKRWNNLIYVPRTGTINFNGGKFRGNKGVYDYLAGNFQNFAYHQEGDIWICCHGKNKEALALARQFKRCCPESRIDLSHKIAPNIIDDFSEEVISCFFLSSDIRPDEPDSDFGSEHFKEIEEKRQIARDNITAISKYALAFQSSPNPEL